MTYELISAIDSWGFRGVPVGSFFKVRRIDNSAAFPTPTGGTPAVTWCHDHRYRGFPPVVGVFGNFPDEGGDLLPSKNRLKGEPRVEDGAGVFDLSLSFVGYVGATETPHVLHHRQTIVIEGDGRLAFYHLDWTDPDAPVARQAVDLQYDMLRRAFTSVAWHVNVTRGTFGGLEPHSPAQRELTIGQPVRIHALISRDGCNSFLDPDDPQLAAVSDLQLVIRARNQFDAPPYVSMPPTGTESMGLPGYDAVEVPYFQFTPGGPRIERLFAQLNAPSAAVPQSAALEADLQLAFTLDGRRTFTPLLPVRLRQPLA
ncbi:MAG: hypothetical protein ABMA13_20655 [Chthoniobacteraceae bacterium]